MGKNGTLKYRGQDTAVVVFTCPRCKRGLNLLPHQAPAWAYPAPRAYLLRLPLGGLSCSHASSRISLRSNGSSCVKREVDL